MLEALRDGRTNADIAIELGLSVNTVKYHVANMLAKLDLHTRDELTGWKPRPGRGLWGIAATRVAFALGVSLAGAAIVAGGILFALHRSTSGSGVDGPPIVFVSALTQTGSGLFSVQPGSTPQQLNGQRSSFQFAPAWSPDGKKLVYLGVSGPFGPEAAGANAGSLTVLDSVTGDARVLDKNAAVQSPMAQLAAPSWTADGSLIIFETYDSVASAIRPDGEGRQDLELGCMAPAWSPDETLATCLMASADGNVVWLMQGPKGVTSTSSGARSQVSSGNATSGARFSRDGRWLAWTELGKDGNEHLFVLAVDSRDPFAGKSKPVDIGPGFDPRWSPSGDKLAFSSAPSIELLAMMTDLPFSLAKQTGDVFIYDPSSEHGTNVTNGMGANFDAAWSPDGRQMAFISMRAGGNDVWIMNADGSHLRRVTDDGGTKLMLAWAPR